MYHINSYDFFLQISVFWHLQNLEHFTGAARQGMLHERIFHKGTPHSNVYPEFSIMLMPKDSYKSLILWIEISCLKVQLRIQDMLQPKSSSGLDNISCRLSKHISDVIAIPLTSLINQSLQSGIFFM